MKQSYREKAFLEKIKSDEIKVIDVFSEEAIHSAFEGIKHSSEYRFDAIASSNAVLAITNATQDFELEQDLKVTIAKRAEEIPSISQCTAFKYSPDDYGSLGACTSRIQNGEDLTVALVWEDDLLIGYGIAVSKNGETEIEIIDVDTYSRRSAGLVKTIQLSGESFQIGVGHVIVNALLKFCFRPIKVDINNQSSEYIFKSFGFVYDSEAQNNLFRLK